MKKKFPTKIFLIRTISNALIIGAILLLGVTLWPIIESEFGYRITESRKAESGEPISLFGRLLGPSPSPFDAADQDFSIVIEKIGLNAPIKQNVDVVNKDEYFQALKNGVAHAKGTALPEDPRGNVYLFAHSDISFWERTKYSSAFNLLRKLDIGDRVHIIYKGKDYIYEVINREILKGFNTYPLTRRVIEPILTLQTCDPPGTSLNRLVVTAKLVT